MTAVLVAGYKGYPTDRMYIPIAEFPTDISGRDGYHNTEGSYSPGMFNRICFLNFSGGTVRKVFSCVIGLFSIVNEV